MTEPAASPDERRPLLDSQAESHYSLPESSSYTNKNSTNNPEPETLPRRIAYRLYLSHFLSTWNSRFFEFGATLYLATIFPDTLLPLSVYALIRGLSAIILSPAVGQYIDNSNRLQCVRVSIVVQRFAVAISCVVFWILAHGIPLDRAAKPGMLALLTFLACIEKLCSIMNLVSVERDWVVVVAEKDESALRTLNAQMRRIDLICKLIGPLFIALIDGISTEVAILVNFVMNIVSVGIEYFAIAQVYNEVPSLQAPKGMQRVITKPGSDVGLSHNLRHIYKTMNESLQDFGFYLHHRLFLPSFAGACLYLTVLSFAGQMVTYLLSAGYSASHVGLTRTLAVVFEIVATWVAPWLVSRIGPTRAGAWLLSTQLLCLAAGTALFWAFENKPIFSASSLVASTILSRLGLRGFDLCVQLILQEGVEAENRGRFSAVEAAWQNLFEIVSYSSTIVFSHPGQFKWPTLISVIAVANAWVLYTIFVRMARGHLLHLDIFKTKERLQDARENSLLRIVSENGL